MANIERRQTKRAVFSFVLQLSTFTTKYFVTLDESKMNEHIFEASKTNEYILDASNLLLKRHVHFEHVVEICCYISMLFWTRHANFQRVDSDIYDPSVRIIKNPLISATFWMRQLISATREIFTLNYYSSTFRRGVISTCRRVNSTRRRIKNAIMTPMAYHSM